MAWYKSSQSDGIQVFHGSREPDLEKLKYHLPLYTGGLGGGVYVGTEMSTATFYGKYVYELKTTFGWDDVLSIGDDNYDVIEPFQGISLSTGEQIPPFCFRIKDKTYCVTDISGNYFGKKMLKQHNIYNNIKKEISGLNVEQYLKQQLVDSTVKYENMDYNISDADDYLDTIDDYVNFLISSGKIKDENAQTEYDRMVSIFNPIMNNLIKKAEEEAERNTPEEIGLDEIGDKAKEAGYKAVYVSGIRGNALVNEEMLVFNEDDLIMIKRIK